MSYTKIKSHAKVNLALNVVGRSKSFHRIESIISFLDLHDEIKIKEIHSKNHKIRFIGKFSNGIKSKNTISQLLKIIDKKKLIKNSHIIILGVPHTSYKNLKISKNKYLIDSWGFFER